MPTNQGRTYGRDSEKKESGSRNKREREAGREEEEREKKVEGSDEKKKITLLLYVDQSVSQSVISSTENRTRRYFSF